MFARALTDILLSSAATFPALLLTGPRQSGKTTLLKLLFPNHIYVNLEAPDTLLRLRSDPRGFLFAGQGKNWVIDEAQQFPELFSWIQEDLDRDPSPGRYIFSGSQNFLLNDRISQTLAGRIAILELLPLTYSEFASVYPQSDVRLWEYLYKGSYPRPWHESLDPDLWYNSYIRTYLERDVRSLMHIRELSLFQLFLKLCAGRHGQLLNLSALANDCGISQTTATHWLSLLEAGYIVTRLRPYFRNFNKRLVKTDKLYFLEPAIVCHLLEIDSPAHLALHAQRGAIFEGYVLGEIIKNYAARGKRAPVYFWRDHAGHEIDFLIEQADGLTAVEAKSAMTFQPALLTGLQKWKKIAASHAKKSLIVYGGDESFQYQGIPIVSWREAAGGQSGQK